MRRGRLRGIWIVAVLFALFAPSALAASPRQIYRDFADNGRLDGTYSRADLQRALQDAAVQGYGQPNVVVTMRPAVQQQLRHSGVAGAQATKTQTQTHPLRAQAAAAGTLPFTGLDVALIAIGGGGLLLLGGGLRRLGSHGV
jgi:hypothetical protein